MNVIEKGSHIIYTKDTNIEILDTETGIVKNRWGVPCRPTSSFTNSPWDAWCSILHNSITSPSIEFFKEWKRWAQAGRIIRMRGVSSSWENSSSCFTGINLTLLRNYECAYIPVGTYDFNEFYSACESELYGQSSATLSNSQHRLFQCVYSFFAPNVMRPLAALIEREKITRFWSDNAEELKSYIETKLRLGEPLSAVRNSWDDFCATLQKVILTNDEISDIMREQFEGRGNKNG